MSPQSVDLVLGVIREFALPMVVFKSELISTSHLMTSPMQLQILLETPTLSAQCTSANLSLLLNCQITYRNKPMQTTSVLGAQNSLEKS